MGLYIQLPSEHTSYEAEQAMRVLSPHIGRNSTIYLQGEAGDSETLKLPQEALTLLMRILAHMAHGEAVALTPIRSEITSQQAVDLLSLPPLSNQAIGGREDSLS